MNAPSVSMPSDAAIDAFLQAGEILEAAPETLNERKIRNAAALLKNAIQSAGVPFPRAEAVLAMTYLTLGDTKDARKYAEAALGHDPSELRAQLVKLDLALQGLQTLDGSVTSLLPTGIGAKYIFAAIFRMARGLFISGSVANTQLRFRNELGKTTEMFRALFSQQQPAIEFLFFSERFMAVADLLRANKLSGPARQLYASVAGVPVNNLVYDEDEEREELKQAVLELHQAAATYA